MLHSYWSFSQQSDQLELYFLSNFYFIWATKSLCYTSPTLRSTMESWCISSDYSIGLITAFWSHWWSRGQCFRETVSTEAVGQTSIFWIIRNFELLHMHLLSYKKLNILKLLLKFNENSDPQKSIFTVHRLLPVVPDSALSGRVRNASYWAQQKEPFSASQLQCFQAPTITVNCWSNPGNWLVVPGFSLVFDKTELSQKKKKRKKLAELSKSKFYLS